MCVFRTSDIGRPELWTAWDGESFGSRFGDPYLASTPADAPNACKVVSKKSFGSVQRIEGSDLNVAVFLRDTGTAERRTWQLAYSLSKDLVNWSEPVALAPLIYFGSRDCNDKA